MGYQKKVSWRNRRIYDHEFLYCIKGRARIIIENREYEIKPSSLILVKPNKLHSFRDVGDSSLEILWVHFDFIYRDDVKNLGSYIKNKYDSLFDNELTAQEFIRKDPVMENGFVFPEYMEISESPLVDKLFQNIYYHFANQECCWQFECKVLLLQILKAIIKQTGATFQNTYSQSISDTVIDYLKRNYTRKISLKDVSKTLGYHQDYLGKVFKKDTGMSLSEFLSKYRVSIAKKLINSNLSLTDISEMVGFSDLYYFSKVFKKYEGYSPTHLKKSMDITPEL